MNFISVQSVMEYLVGSSAGKVLYNSHKEFSGIADDTTFFTIDEIKTRVAPHIGNPGFMGLAYDEAGKFAGFIHN